MTRSIALAVGIALLSCTTERSPLPTIAMSAENTTASASEDVDIPASVVVTPSKISALDIGASVTVAGAVYNSSGKALSRIMHWSSADSMIASVATTRITTAVIRARAAGSVVITATGGGISTTLDIVVKPPQAVVAKVVVSLTSSSLSIGATTQATATPTDVFGRVLSGQTIVWTSVNPTVATVSTAGLVTAIAAGSSAITATVGGVSGNAIVTVAPAAPPANTPTETLAALPRVFLNTTAPSAPAAGGTIISVPSGGNLQLALNNVRPGDVIELANGATFSGNFALPNKNTSSASWIVIRPKSMVGVPPEGTRMTPAQAAAARLPIILSNSNQGAFYTDTGAHHYRLIALEVSVPASIDNTGLIRFGSGYETTVARLPHDLVLDRMYIHGTPTGENRRCVGLNSASSAVIDSYISDCHEDSGDAQAIAGWNGPGPFKIVNNYLEASAENINWGGADPTISGLIPSDIEIRRNHFFKPVTWKNIWLVKNLFEIKNAQRVLVEGNILENNWQDGQGGSAIVLKSVNQNGGCTWCVARDITFRLNLIKNTGAGFALSGRDVNTQVSMERVTITDNIVTGIDIAPYFDGDGRGFLINNDPIDIVIAHNTVIDPTNTAITFGGPATLPPVRLVFRDNIVGGGQYGVKGPGLGTAATFAAFMRGGGYVGNVLTRQSSAGYPAGNFFAASLAAVGFANSGALDFHLTAASAYKGKASDGRDPGANIDAVNAAVAGVVVR